MNLRPSKNLFLALACAALAYAPLPQAVAVQTIDEIAAIVNDDVITRGELEQQYQTAVRQLMKQKVQPPPRNLLLKQTLERMITERAVLQNARASGIRVDPAQIERAVQRIASQNNLSVDELKMALARDGMNYERFRESLGNEILISRARERQVESKITVSEAEIDSYLQTQESTGKGDEFNLSHIFIAVPENTSPEQIQARRDRAQGVLNELSKGADFAQLSASYSDAPNALDGGSLGWRNAGQIPAFFQEIVKSLTPGQTSDIIKSPSGFHILKLNEKRGKEVTTVITQTRARHILIKPSEITSESDAINRLAQIRERIEQGGEKFENMARQYSEDPGSAAKGGDLGWVSPGDTVPQFERAMDALQPGGDLSPVVQSPFGWHLIQVLERRQQDVTSERQRTLARQAIRERKADEAVEEWTRQVRDQAYVEIRPFE